MPKTPQLKQHATGQWFCKWGGQNHYFGTDRQKAESAYLVSLQDWTRWRQAKRAKRPSMIRRPLLIAGMIERFLDEREAEGGAGRRRHYSNHLRLFNAGFGNVRGDLIRAQHINALKMDMVRAKYAPKTINHHLSSIKTLLNWAIGLEIIPPVALQSIKGLTLPPVPDKSLTKRRVRHILRDTPERAKPWVAINYLCLMRPSEVVKVINGLGTWEQPWLFRLTDGKTDRRAQEFRRIVFSDRALWWLKQAVPHWSRQDSYYRAIARAGVADAPHPLRHTAATHLDRLGVARSDIDLLLGHLPPRVSRTYVRIDWQSLRATASRLSL